MIKLAPERGEERSYQQVQYTVLLKCIIQTVLLSQYIFIARVSALIIVGVFYLNS
jgi:hypothetical protein